MAHYLKKEPCGITSVCLTLFTVPHEKFKKSFDILDKWQEILPAMWIRDSRDQRLPASD